MQKKNKIKIKLNGKIITDYATPADLLKYDKALKQMKSENER